MSTLTRKTPVGEYFEGFLSVKDKTDGSTDDPVHFYYRFPNEKEVNQILEIQPIKGLQMDKNSLIIYTSEPRKFSGSDELDLETEPRTRKVKKVLYDFRNSRRQSMRTKGTADKDLYLGKLITLE